MPRIPELPRELASLTPEQREARREARRQANRDAAAQRRLARDVEFASIEADRRMSHELVASVSTPPPAPVSPAPGVPAGIAAEDVTAFEAALAPLKRRTREFVANFHIVGRNASEAARRAGYSAHTAKAIASKVMQRPDVKKAIADIDALMAKASAFTFDDLSRELRDAATFARSTGNASALMKGIELLGKHHGHLTDRLDVRAAGAVTFVFPERRRTDDE